MQRVISLLLLVCLLGTTTSPSIVGDWTLDKTVISFLQDNTYHSDDGKHVDNGPYTISDDQTTLTATFHGHIYSGKLTWIDNDTVQETIHFFFGQKTFTFHRLTLQDFISK
jgi:hypothetical protein